MSTEANNNAQNTTRVAPAGTTSALGTTAAAVSHPTPPLAPAIPVSRRIETRHHAYAPYPPPPHYHHPPSYHYPPTQSEVPVHHPGQATTNVQVAEANILSSMKKAPLATIVNNPAEDDEGEEEEFGKLSGRKLDSSFAEGSAVQNSDGDGNITSQHRAPTPLLLSPDDSTDGAATSRIKGCSDAMIGASKDERSSNSAKVGESEEATSSTGGSSKTRIAGTSSSSKGAGHKGNAPLSSKLSELDAMTCHNIEVFQATKEDAEAFESAEAVRLLGTSTAKQVICGHVGFRCVHCFAGEHVGPLATGNSGLSVVYPASVETISTALRHMRDHFDSCEAMSEESKNDFADARREEEERDAGLGRRCRREKSGGKNCPDERRRIAFLDFCVDFCQRKDIINMQPPRSGLKYRLPFTDSSSAAVGTAAAAAAAAGIPNVGMPRQGPVPTTDAMFAKKDDASLLPTSLPPVTTSTAVPPNVGNYVPNFPFFSDGHGAYICRYCCSVPYPYRGAGSVWNAPNQAPPTREFVDQHMKLCKGGAPPPPQRVVVPARAPSTPHTPQMPPLPGNAIEAKSGTVTMGTMQVVPPHQRLSGPRASPAAGAVSTPQQYYRMSPQVLRSPHMPHPYHQNPYARPLAHPPSNRPPIAPVTATFGKKPQRRGTRAPRARPPTQKELELPPGVDGSGSDSSLQAAIAYLVQQESSRCLPPPKDRQIELVGSEDKLLLTDYFSHLMRQLRLVRFSEADRKTRGGKREKVSLGYGGLECVHCIGQPGARKFFWSNVDRLSNSFAEIPAHILKCKYCAPEVKAALLELKTCHAKQMLTKPRGSQKVYLRRAWRRIHDGDPSPSSSGSASQMPMLLPSLTNCGVAETATGTGTAARGSSVVAAAAAAAADSGAKSRMSTAISSAIGAGASSSMPPLPSQGNNGDDSPSSIERSATKSLASLAATGARRGSPLRTPPSRGTVTATTADQSGTGQDSNSSPTVIIGPHTRLIGNSNAYVDATPSCGTCKHGAEALAHAAASQSTGEFQFHPIVMLAIREDKEWLSDHDCFVRRNLEVFTAGEKDVLTARADRKLAITVGQVGIRCLHCAVAVSRYSNGRRGARGTAVVYPLSISNIFECVKELHRNHLENGCPHLPADVKLKILELKGSMASSLSSVLRRYYVMAAKALGMVDCGKEGIRAGGMSQSVPLTEHEYAAASDRVRDVPLPAGPLVDAAGHLRTRAAKVVAAATAASGQDATSNRPNASDTKATGAAVVEKAETTPKKNGLPDPVQPDEPKAGRTNPTRPTIDASNCEASDVSDSVPQNQSRGLHVATGGVVAAPAAATATSTAAPPVVYGYAPLMASVPPPHYGYQPYRYGGAYGGPPGAVQGSFLASAITPLESRKRKAPLARETPPNSDEAQRPKKTRR